MINNEYSKGLQKQKQEIQKERYKFFDQRNAYNKLLRERARQEELNEIIDKTVNNGYLPSLNYVPSDIKSSNNDLLVSLNDIHYGSNIKNAWNEYNSDICKERFNKYLDRIIEIQKLYNSENAIVWCNGDEISGNIHNEIAVTNKENVIEQIVGVSELIAEFLSTLSKHFKQIRFVSVSGNHSRIDTKDKALQSERLDDLVEWYLKSRLQNFDNIIFDDYNKIDPTMYMVNIRGLNYAGCHGDYDRSIDKVLGLKTMLGKPIYAILYGHLHHNKIDTYQGVLTIMSGSFQGMDNFCVSKRIYGNPEQMVCVVTDEGLFCSYNIQLK